MLMRLRMLKLSIGKGRQVIKQLCRRMLQYYATVATERAGYVLYKALVCVFFGTAIPTSSINFIQLFFILVIIMCTRHDNV